MTFAKKLTTRNAFLKKRKKEHVILIGAVPKKHTAEVEPSF